MSYEPQKLSAEFPYGLSADNSYFYQNLKIRHSPIFYRPKA